MTFLLNDQLTINFPRNMFIPQAKLNVPDLRGVKTTVTGWLSGRSRRMFSDGITTSVPQVSSTLRIKVNRVRIPFLSRKLEGRYPREVTLIVTFWACRAERFCPFAGDTANMPKTTNIRTKNLFIADALAIN
ncbi:MAG TPA: hypothetical protein VGQ55_02435 [Pyrinomonadaceae bacterium]|nr:hypothetical protein [Pyrinomonadaceae bacterium]